jgi:hypothetical protein
MSETHDPYRDRDEEESEERHGELGQPEEAPRPEGGHGPAESEEPPEDEEEDEDSA